MGVADRKTRMMEVNLEKRILIGVGRVFAASAIIVSAFGMAAAVHAKASASDNQKASISIQGTGAPPNTKISLSTGPSQELSTQTDRNGNFLFSNLIYSSFVTLKFSLDIPPNESGMAKKSAGNHLELMFDPKGSKARISGNIGKSGTLAFNLEGADSSIMQIAGEEGRVNLQTRTGIKLASGKAELRASIINVGEVCCPRMVVPAPPVTLTISSIPVHPVTAPTKQTAPAAVPAPSIPYTQPGNVKESMPETVAPEEKRKDIPESKPEKKKVPYIVQGVVHTDKVVISDETMAAVSFPSSAYDETYVGGLRQITDGVRNSILHGIVSIGTFFDARNLNDALRSLRVSSVETMKNYAPSDTICRFGTLSRSLALSEAIVDRNRMSFSKMLFDRNRQQFNTVFSSPGMGLSFMIKDFKVKYCENADNNGFLNGYCAAVADASDVLYNRDVDFTRVFDTPLTFDADFATNTDATNDQQSLIALFDNLSKIPPYMDGGKDAFDPNKNLLTTQDARAVNAARDVAGNTFGALVGERARTTAASAEYMRAVLTQIGVTEEDAIALIGENPSYFAQMEILTKKIFQDPVFYANLYDSPANIDRQRVAMKAVELQQDRDFLESLRRREMLLSVLLNLKLETDTARAKESGTMSSN